MEPCETSLLQHHCAEKKLPSASKCPMGIHSSAEQVRDKKCIEEEEEELWARTEACCGRREVKVGWMPSAVTFPPPPLHPQKSNSSAPVYFVHCTGEKRSRQPHSVLLRFLLEAPTTRAKVHLPTCAGRAGGRPCLFIHLCVLFIADPHLSQEQRPWVKRRETQSQGYYCYSDLLYDVAWQCLLLRSFGLIFRCIFSGIQLKDALMRCGSSGISRDRPWAITISSIR